jgi:hypothetical protein
MLDVLLRSKEFWAAVILLIAALANWLIPNVPKEVVSAVLALLGVISGILAGQAVARYLEMAYGAYR